MTCANGCATVTDLLTDPYIAQLRAQGNADMLMHARSMEAIRPRSPDERRAEWASKFFAAGHHRTPSKPRIRVVTVPAPFTTSEPAHPAKDSA